MNGQMVFGAGGSNAPFANMGMPSANNLYSYVDVQRTAYTFPQNTLGPLPDPFPSGAQVGFFGRTLMQIYYYVE